VNDADCCGRENGWKRSDPCTFASQAMTVLTYRRDEVFFQLSLALY